MVFPLKDWKPFTSYSLEDKIAEKFLLVEGGGYVVVDQDHYFTFFALQNGHYSELGVESVKFLHFFRSRRWSGHWFPPWDGDLSLEIVVLS